MTEKGANTNYGFGDIHRYLSGQMTAKEMHDMERAALQDPFLSDAIEGFQNANKEQSEKHLNEITAALQGNHQEAKIIGISKRKRYGWLAAASVILLISISVFVLYQNQNNNPAATLASNDIKSGKTKDSHGEINNATISPQTDSVTADALKAKIPAKPNVPGKTETAILNKKEREPQNTTTSALPPPQQDSMLIASAPVAAFTSRSKTMSAPRSLSTTSDTLNNRNADTIEAFGLRKKIAAPSSETAGTTDKGKPFLSSEIEVVNLRNVTKKETDTTAIKPEGGWLLFQDYLFSKLNKKNSSAVANGWNRLGDVELQFSVSETGLPYDVQVIHAPDSATAGKAVSAIENGPKWINRDKKEKRLNIKF